MTKKLTKKERKFNDETENSKDFIAYEAVKLYAKTDIPITKKTSAPSNMLTPHEVWSDFHPHAEELNEQLVEENDNYSRYTFCAKHCDDGKLIIDLFFHKAKYETSKTVLLIGETANRPQSAVINAIVDSGCNVIVADYNGIGQDTLTVFPESLNYGKHGQEGIHNKKVCPSAKATCQYLYTLIFRRCISFICDVLHLNDIVVTGIRTGTEIAMQVAGMEKSRVRALACLCGAGYPEYTDIPKFSDNTFNTMDSDLLCWMIGVSGVAYMRNYPNPVFAAIGSNGTYSDVDRLSALQELIHNRLTVSISLHSADNINAKSFGTFLTWLNYAFINATFPDSPTSIVEINRDGSVYADIKAQKPIDIQQAVLYYSYGNHDHKTRYWRKTVCETIGVAQYLARLDFNKVCDDLYYYAVITYINGLTVTEFPKFMKMSGYRISVIPQKNNTLLYQYDVEGMQISEVHNSAVILQNGIKEGVGPAGIKGVVCSTGSMQIFVGDNCRTVESTKILQVDSYSAAKNYTLELIVTGGASESVNYHASKYIMGANTFAGTQFACTDFKDSHFRPLTEWKEIKSITIVTRDVIINKLIFI